MSDYFQKQQLEKRSQFHERVHAAFILETSLNHWGNLTDEQNDWLAFAYPGTEIETGEDQGLSYTTITPKF